MSDVIVIDELEVFFRVGVPQEERQTPQRLLITVEMTVDFARAAARDDISETVDYFAVTEQIKSLGRDREWKLIEALAADVAELVGGHSRVEQVVVEVSKFILPETRRVAVRLKRATGTAT